MALEPWERKPQISPHPSSHQPGEDIHPSEAQPSQQDGRRLQRGWRGWTLPKGGWRPAAHQGSSPWVRGAALPPPAPQDPIPTRESRFPKHSCSFPGITHQDCKAGPSPAGPGRSTAHPPPAVNHQPHHPALSLGTQGTRFPRPSPQPPRGNVIKDVSDPDLLTRAPGEHCPPQADMGSAETQATGTQGGRTEGHWRPSRGGSFKGPDGWQEPPSYPRAARTALRINHFSYLLPQDMPGSAQACQPSLNAVEASAVAWRQEEGDRASNLGSSPPGLWSGCSPLPPRASVPVSSAAWQTCVAPVGSCP